MNKKTRILVVHPVQDMLDQIGDLLSDLSARPEFDLVYWSGRTLADALKKLSKGPFDLLVTALDIAADDASPVAAGESGRRGLDLVHILRSAAPQLQSIIVTGKSMGAAAPDKSIEKTQWVDEGQAFGEELTATVTHVLESHPAVSPSQVELWISLSHSGCSYQFLPDGEKPSPFRPIDMDDNKLKSFVDLSRLLHVKEPTWEIELKSLGEGFADELFQPTPKNIKLKEELDVWKGHVGIDNIRVRFSVEGDLHALAVEAVKQRNEDCYWMDRTAIYRGLEVNWDGTVTAPFGLFQDERTRSGPINILIIQADVLVPSDVKEGKLSLHLDPLPGIAYEVESITRLLARIKNEGERIGEVCVISCARLPTDASFSEAVQTALTEKAWHIVHYAGHTHYANDEKAGYLFFPRADPNRPLEPIRIDLFAWMLRKADTRFVFLSSCRSAGQDFIYHLAREHIPAIMGFLWVVRDDRAVDFAKSFYEHLFTADRRTLENACFEAKKEMHARFPNDPIWASPVLVMQFGA